MSEIMSVEYYRAEDAYRRERLEELTHPRTTSVWESLRSLMRRRHAVGHDRSSVTRAA